MKGRGTALAIIPARGGSRGLPGKLVRSLGGVPVIAHTIRAASASARIDHVLVSTDDRGIRRVASAHGGVVPFLRPAELATDDAPTGPAVRHAVEWFEASAGKPVELIVTLQPTSPLRTATEIDAAVALLDDPAIDSAVSVTPIGMPASVLGIVHADRWRSIAPPAADVRRQASPPAMRLTGGIYVTRRALVDEARLVGDRVAALVVDADSAIDIDVIDDLRRARAALRRRGA